MTVSAIDSAITGGLFATPAMRAVVADHARLQRLLDVEAALARAQARLGLIPARAAREITAKATSAWIDVHALAEGTERSGYPIVPLVAALSEACAGDAGRFVHWGATTQDIVDTGLVLQIRDGLDLVEKDLGQLEATLVALAREHRDTVMAGRTHLQHALPVTFGFKAATWLAPLRRHRARLAGLRPRVEVVQLFGAAGTAAALEGEGIAVLEALASELSLGVPEIAWHTARDGPAEVVSFLGLLSGTLAKIAADIALLTQTEVEEVREPYLPGRGGSSTMPQKRNPIGCEFVLAAAANLRQLVPVMLGAMVQDHERATGSWHAEWIALPQAFALGSGALHHLRQILDGLEVDPRRMRANLELTRGMISAEGVMMALAPQVGREQAHHIVAAACRQAADGGLHLLEVLRTDPHVAARLSPQALRDLLDPERGTGSAGRFVDRVLAGGETPARKEHDGDP